jgi:hypothetical protein
VITPEDARIINQASITSRARIVASPQAEAGERATLAITSAPTPPAPVVQPDDYISKVAKLIPSEIVAAFVTINGILKASVGVSPLAGWLVFVVLWIVTPLYYWRTTTLSDAKTAYAQIAIATVSFPVWVFALGGPFAGLGWYNSVYGSIVLVLFTLLPPMILGKPKQQPSP